VIYKIKRALRGRRVVLVYEAVSGRGHFALDVEAIGNQARSNAVLLGYMYTPYTAQTVWAPADSAVVRR
jgi:hypothetical protein